MKDIWKVRTKNKQELKVLSELQAENWSVLKRGWPDFLAIKRGYTPRFIEVKQPGGRLSRAQKIVASILKEHFGIQVEVRN